MVRPDGGANTTHALVLHPASNHRLSSSHSSRGPIFFDQLPSQLRLQECWTAFST